MRHVVDEAPRFNSANAKKRDVLRFDGYKDELPDVQ
jgi:hypothetical protein